MTEDYLKQINAKIKEMDDEILKLQKQAKEKGAKAQAELNKNLEKYKENHKELQRFV